MTLVKPVPHLSLLIPTHKRAAILRQCLDHIEQQTIKDQLEVIVVSDGPDAETTDLFEKRKTNNEKRSWSFPLTFFTIEKSQQGIARNRAVEKASADHCLLIGDDIFLAPDACEKHLAAHKAADPAAVLGFITWDPSLEITPVMRWLEASGWQFGFPKIQEHAHSWIPPSTQHLFTYTSNLSLPTSILKTHPFREDATMYGWEDIEWGKRLAADGIRLFYEPDAKALHHHQISLEDSLRRMKTLGESAMRMEKMSPGFGRVPRGWKKIAYQVMAMLPTLRGKHARAFLEGMRGT